MTKPENPSIEGGDNAQTVAVAELRSLIERIERLEDDKAMLAEDIRDIYVEAKSKGFDTKAMRAIIRMRKKERAELAEQMATLRLYAEALGMGIFS